MNEEKNKRHPVEITLFIIFLVVFIIIPMASGLWQKEDTNTTPEYKSFYGYDCISDCSGHKAGYDWAEDKGITDSDDCGGNSNSFREGCKAYVEGDINFGNSE